MIGFRGGFMWERHEFFHRSQRSFFSQARTHTQSPFFEWRRWSLIVKRTWRTVRPFFLESSVLLMSVSGHSLPWNLSDKYEVSHSWNASCSHWCLSGLLLFISCSVSSSCMLFTSLSFSLQPQSSLPFLWMSWYSVFRESIDRRHENWRGRKIEREIEWFQFWREGWEKRAGEEAVPSLLPSLVGRKR